MSSHSQKLDLKIASLGCFAFALLFYSLTMAPTFGWGDSADLAMRMAYAGDRTFVGSSRDYPLYRSIGFIFQMLPIGDVGVRANFMTAFFGAVTVGLVAFISGYISRNSYAALAAGISLTVAHTFWLMSAIAEVYTFNTSLVFSSYALIALWWRSQNIIFLFGTIFFAGLALAHHSTGLLVAATLVPLILLRLRTLPLLVIIGLVLLYMATSSIYWERTIMRLLADRPFLEAVGLQIPNNPFFQPAPIREFLKFIAYIGYNFFGIGFLLVGFGFFMTWKKKYPEMIPIAFWLFLITVAGVTSSIPDKFNIYVLAYPVLAICVGFGAAFIVKNKKQAIMLITLLAVIPPLGYVLTVYTVKSAHIDLVGARQIPYRDNDWYFLWPSKHSDNGPRRYAEEAMHAVDKDGVLIADYSLWRVLYLVQTIEKLRPDINVVWEEPLFTKGVVHYINSVPCPKSVFLATNTPPEYYELADIKAHFAIEQQGVVFKVIRQCKN